ncbi:MAG: cupin domain-containing protein [Verrucomicrobia bacterium]|nr:MAG: cupin domain-containing protein [Verrucomicrobiota bacterium]
MSKESGTITRQREGPVLRAFGEELIVQLDGEPTSEKLAMWTNMTPPGGGPPPHYHSNEDETFHVLEGRFAFLADGQWRESGPGDSAFMPRGVVHTFKNVGDQPSSMLITATPSGFERFFARCAEESRSRGGAPDMARLVAIAEFISCCSHGPVGRFASQRAAM